ncbi:ubiquitin-protein ligase [Lithospermum erythrorhizon]|uniref:Ubiquitin-protein ligase n=1 Tax=Lithospermum erythrorhizon TaxID=34254 RepID=A0AAV3QUK0_LITER
MGEHLVVNLDRLEKTEFAQAPLQCQGTEVVSKLTKIAEMPSSSSMGDNKDKEKVIVEVDEENDLANEEAPLIGQAECRICQDEDSIQNLESPCACNGSLKYAHRKCVQHWCNEKGDITCEICHQSYQPGYVAPPRPEAAEAVIDIGGGWQIAGTPINLHDPRLLTIAEAERQMLEAEYEDFNARNASGAAFFRSVVLILMALLLMRHALSINDDGDDEDPSTVFSLFLLRAIGFLLPCYIMVFIITVLQRRRQRQEVAALAASPFTVLVQSGQNRGIHFAYAAPAPIPVPATAATSISTPRSEEV